MTFWCGSGSIPLTNGSGRPKNMWIRWIRIRIRIRSTDCMCWINLYKWLFAESPLQTWPCYTAIPPLLVLRRYSTSQSGTLDLASVQYFTQYITKNIPGVLQEHCKLHYEDPEDIFKLFCDGPLVFARRYQINIFLVFVQNDVWCPSAGAPGGPIHGLPLLPHRQLQTS